MIARETVISVRDLRVGLTSSGTTLNPVDGISFHIHAGETFAIVGESGCGKSLTALSLLQLLPPQGRITGGQVVVDGRELTGLSPREMRTVRGDAISMIFQEPMTSLNPILTVGAQIVEALRAHRPVRHREAREQAVALLDRCGVPAPAQRADSYPHELSGGMRQRAMIAMAIACRPKLLIADEPTTALDVTIQGQILDLIEDLKQELGMGVLLITHDFGVVVDTAQRTAVMYAGRLVETADTDEIFTHPAHPYTKGLLASTPRLGAKTSGTLERLAEIPGIVPDLAEGVSHCAFAPRCGLAFETCWAETPRLADVPGRPDHTARCFAVSSPLEASA